MIIFVGSKNPVKVNAVKQAVAHVWPDCLIRGIEVPSGVNSQPTSDDETRQGAENRAKAVLAQGLIELQNEGMNLEKEEVLGVGLEGGVFTQGKQMWSTVWSAVTDKSGHLYVTNGSRMKIHSIIAQKIWQGEEMGKVVEELSGQLDIRTKQGMIGLVTNNFVDRTEEYMHIVKLAFGVWYGRDWVSSAII
jgi:inosine/xanthosine triphosphatase